MEEPSIYNKMRDLLGRKYNKIIKIVSSTEVKAITVDVFDTILLRNTKSELQRYFEIAQLQQALLKQEGVNACRDSMFHARLISTNIAYRTAPLNRHERDARIEKIFELMCESLSIDIKYIEKFIDVELEYERNNIELNRNLVDMLSHIGNKRKIYLLSDTYLAEKYIRHLLNFKEARLAYNGIYASCEYSLTKCGGGLFDLFCEREGVSPCAILHIGDNYHSDVQVPRRRGMAAVYLPRDLSWKVKRYSGEFIYRLRMKGMLL